MLAEEELLLRYPLVDDEVGGKAQHGAVALLVRTPAQAEGHEEEPRALEQCHLVVQVKAPEAWGGRGGEMLLHYTTTV